MDVSFSLLLNDGDRSRVLGIVVREGIFKVFRKSVGQGGHCVGQLCLQANKSSRGGGPTQQ